MKWENYPLNLMIQYFSEKKFFFNKTVIIRFSHFTEFSLVQWMTSKDLTAGSPLNEIYTDILLSQLGVLMFIDNTACSLHSSALPDGWSNGKDSIYQ